VNVPIMMFSLSTGRYFDCTRRCNLRVQFAVNIELKHN